MITRTAQGATHPAEAPDLPDQNILPRWYAAYTCANREKRVSDQLLVRRVEHFVPTYGSERRWKDRQVMLQLPLFPGYVFVRIAMRDRFRVVQVPGVAWLVSFNGSPAPLPDEQIAALQSGLASGMKAEPYPFLPTGCRVRIKNGPLGGLTGILLRFQAKSRVVISVELLRQSVAVDVFDADLEPVP